MKTCGGFLAPPCERERKRTSSKRAGQVRCSISVRAATQSGHGGRVVPFDSIALWALTIVNSFVIILVIRQLATLPKYNRPPGPRPGAPFDDWVLTTLSGEQRSANQMPSEYLMLIAAERCGPCHALFAQLAHAGRPRGHFVIAGEGDAAVLSQATSTPTGPLSDEYLAGVDLAFMQRFDIPSTPYGLAVKRGRIVASGPARTPAELQRIADIFAPAVSGAAVLPGSPPR